MVSALGAVREPHHDGHDTPESRSPAHNAATPATRQARTETAPRRRNSPVAGAVPRACTICRHNRVAGEPTYVRFGPTLTPTRTASSPGDDATAGSSTSVAGRLFSRFVRFDTAAATPSSPGGCRRTRPGGPAPGS